MSIYVERARELRAITEIHYNCAQSVVLPFADVLGVDEDTLFRMAANFGGGMKMAATCGAVTGALMVLGLAGMDEVPELQKLYRRVKENHEGTLTCSELLRIMARDGGQKKPHCDGMVYELVGYTEEILRNHGIIPPKT